MKIAITMRVDSIQEYEEKRDALSHEWIPLLEDMNCIPVLIPNVIKDVKAYVKSFNVKAVLLTGGNDVCSLSNEEPISDMQSDTFPGRDTTENCLLDFAVKNNLPVIGVCRGMQIINIYFKGNLIRDIQSQIGNKVNHVASCHEVKIIKDSFINFFGNSSLLVNSYHNQGITLETLSNSYLLPFAVSESDGIVEGIFHKHLPILGIQWHPERKNPATDADKKLFDTILNRNVFW